MHWPGIEPGVPAWQAKKFYHLTGTNALLKTDSLPYKRHFQQIFMVKIEKEKENKQTKNKPKQKQTNKHKRQGRKGYTNNPGGRALTLSGTP